MKKSFIATFAAVVLAGIMYFASNDLWVLLGTFLISLHINFLVLVVTLPEIGPIKKIIVSYKYGAYLIILGGVGFYIISALSAILLIASPLYYLIVGRKYEINYGDKKRKARKPKSEPEINKGSADGGFVSIKDVPFLPPDRRKS